LSNFRASALPEIGKKLAFWTNYLERGEIILLGRLNLTKLVVKMECMTSK